MADEKIAADDPRVLRQGSHALVEVLAHVLGRLEGAEARLDALEAAPAGQAVPPGAAPAAAPAAAQAAPRRVKPAAEEARPAGDAAGGAAAGEAGAGEAGAGAAAVPAADGPAAGS